MIEVVGEREMEKATELLFEGKIISENLYLKIMNKIAETEVGKCPECKKNLFLQEMDKEEKKYVCEVLECSGMVIINRS